MISYREAGPADLGDLMRIRYAVRENRLSFQLPEARVLEGLTTRGRGWVAEDDGAVVGFSMADEPDEMIWALFLLPDWEGRGIGRALLDRAVEWLWSRGVERITLTTAPQSRAEGFYARLGWTAIGDKNGEVVFELRRPDA